MCNFRQGKSLSGMGAISLWIVSSSNSRRYDSVSAFAYWHNTTKEQEERDQKDRNLYKNGIEMMTI